MKYKIVFTRRAMKDISGLETSVKDRIKNALARYREDPLKYATKMADPSLGTLQVQDR